MGTLVLNKKSASVKLEGEHLLIHDRVDGSLQRVSRTVFFRRIAFCAFDEEMRRTQTCDGCQVSVRTGIDRTVCRYLESLESTTPLAFFHAA